MNAIEVAQGLEHHNRWRCGEEDDTAPRGAELTALLNRASELLRAQDRTLYDDLATALGTDPMDSHESRVATAKRLRAAAQPTKGA